jgi:hypothetical protein
MATESLDRMARLVPREMLQWEAFKVVLGLHPELHLNGEPSPEEVQVLGTRFLALAWTANVAVAAFYGALQTTAEATEGTEPQPEPPVVPIDRRPRRA